MRDSLVKFGAVMMAASALSGCVSSGTKLGSGGSMVSGAGGAAGNSQAAAQLTKCDRPLGTAALVEEDIPGLAQAGLTSPVPLLRLMMTQSGCFRVVDRGQAMQRMQQERALAAGGTLQGGSNIGGGQMVAADFMITPNVIFQDTNAGGSGAGLGAFLPGIAGVVAGAIKTTNLQAQTMLTLTDVRTGVQEAVAEGSAQHKDVGFAFGAGGLGALPIGGVGGSYASTDIGKVVAAAFMDAHNKLVDQVRAMPAIQAKLAAPLATQTAAPPTSSAPPIPATAPSLVAGSSYKTVTNLNLRGGPSTNDPVIGKLAAGESVTAVGEQNAGWWKVTNSAGQQGWVSARNLRQGG